MALRLDGRHLGLDQLGGFVDEEHVELPVLPDGAADAGAVDAQRQRAVVELDLHPLMLGVRLPLAQRRERLSAYGPAMFSLFFYEIQTFSIFFKENQRN